MRRGATGGGISEHKSSTSSTPPGKVKYSAKPNVAIRKK